MLFYLPSYSSPWKMINFLSILICLLSIAMSFTSSVRTYNSSKHCADARNYCVSRNRVIELHLLNLSRTIVSWVPSLALLLFLFCFSDWLDRTIRLFVALSKSCFPSLWCDEVNLKILLFLLSPRLCRSLIRVLRQVLSWDRAIMQQCQIHWRK